MRHVNPATARPLSIGILLRNGFHLESLGAFIDLAATSRTYFNELCGPVDSMEEPLFDIMEITLVSGSQNPASSSKIPVQTNGRFEDHGLFDLVVMPGFELAEDAARKPICSARELEWLRRQYGEGATVMACGASVFALAEARLTIGTRIVVPWWLVAAFSERFPGAIIEQAESMSDDRRILTAEPGLDHALTIKILRRMVSANLARWLARRRSPPGGQAAPGGLYEEEIVEEHDALVSAAQAWLEQNYSSAVKVSDLARHLNVSARTLERHFVAARGMSPLAYLQSIRIDAARRMLSRKVLKVGRVSNLVGYSDVKFFRQLFERLTGRSPEAFQHQVGATIHQRSDHDIFLGSRSGAHHSFHSSVPPNVRGAAGEPWSPDELA